MESRAPARICALNGDDSLSANGTLSNISGRGARIVVNQPFPTDTPVRIDVGETLLLGDVCYCRQDPEGFSIGVALSHSILEMTAVGDLMERLVGLHGAGAHASQPAEAISPLAPNPD
ncbi:MAG: PilZ domain-containing protein [Acidobacteria bacterium]|nr:PilZ domain-containing protein [Acidobacteriota bacterium]